MTGGSLEETVLGVFGNLILVDFEETAVCGDLLVVESLEFCSFGGNGDTLKGSLT